MGRTSPIQIEDIYRNLEAKPGTDKEHECLRKVGLKLATDTAKAVNFASVPAHRRSWSWT
jgi:hypothetical protein